VKIADHEIIVVVAAARGEIPLDRDVQITPELVARKLEPLSVPLVALVGVFVSDIGPFRAIAFDSALQGRADYHEGINDNLVDHRPDARLQRLVRVAT